MRAMPDVGDLVVSWEVPHQLQNWKPETEHVAILCIPTDEQRMWLGDHWFWFDQCSADTPVYLPHTKNTELFWWIVVSVNRDTSPSTFTVSSLSPPQSIAAHRIVEWKIIGNYNPIE